MKNTIQICTKGVWDSTIPGIKFDSEGVSNYARIQEHLTNLYPRNETGRNRWKKIVEEIKKKGKNKKYDCIIGVSGGVDSSYLLYLAKEYGLKPLALNLDNGWNSDIAVKNIHKMTSALNIDLETYVVDYEEMKDILRAYMRAGLPWIDAPTDLAIKSVMYKFALKEGIKYIIRGNDFRSEGKQPREWTYSDNKQLRYIHKKFGEHKLVTFPRLSYYKIFYAGFVRKIRDIRPYYYLDYKKKEAREFLEKEFKWEYYGGHHHENLFTKFAFSYWLPKKFGIDKRKINLSAQIMNGEVKREEAFNIISKPFYDNVSADKDKNYVLKKLDIPAEEFQEIFSAPNKYYFDYPSYFNSLMKYKKVVAPIVNLIYAHKPMSFVEMDHRE